MSKLVLGKGLGALIPTEDPAAVESTAGAYRMLALDQIQPNPMQPRREFDQEKLAELADSLKVNGMMQPLVVKEGGDGFLLIAGERRFRAARLAGLTHVPVIINNDVEDDVRMLELALVENIQRENLNPLELAAAYKKLIEQCGLTQQDLSLRVNKSRTAVTNTLRLLTLPVPVQEMLKRGQLTEGHARALLSLASPDDIVSTARHIVDSGFSVRETEQVTARTKKRRLVPKRKMPAISEVETYLKQVLGTSVKITPGLKRGRIEIEYYGDDDLGRLLELFRKITA